MSMNVTRAENNADVIVALMGAEPVTVKTAMEIPMICRCVNMIAGAVAMLPIRLYKRVGDGVEEITDDRRLDILNRDTGDTMNADYMRYAWVRDLLLTGAGYAYIERRGGRADKLYYVASEEVSRQVNRMDPIHKVFRYYVGGSTVEPWQMLKILRNTDGYGGGRGILDENAEIIGTAYSLIKYQKKQVTTGGAKRGMLRTNGAKKEVLEDIKERWAALWGGKNDRDTMFILNAPDSDFKELSTTSVDMQINQTQETIDKELMKLFGTSDGLLTEETVKNAVLPVIDIIEAALDADLLLESEKATHYFAFDTRELTRGDINQRYTAYATALSQNFLQLDEVRAMEDLPPLNVNFIKLGLQDVLYDPKTGIIYTPNTDKKGTMEEGSLKEGAMSEKPGLTKDEIGSIIENRADWVTINGKHVYLGKDSGSSGGGGSSIAKDASDAKKALQEAIKSGKISTKVDKKRQAEHKIGSDAFNKRKEREEEKGESGDIRFGYTTLSNMEIQEIINENLWNGEVHDNGNGHFKVIISFDKDGVYYDSKFLKEAVQTDRATVHLSKDGAHLVPAIPQSLKDKKFGKDK